MRRVLLCLAVLICVTAVAVAQTRKRDRHREEGDVEKAAMHNAVWIVDAGANGQNKFTPDSLPNVQAGDQVTFRFHGTHTATSDDIKTGDPKYTFNTGKAIQDQQVTLFFNRAGTYKYHCEYHNGMTGTITVQ